jgi:hypothetical protein
MNRLIRPVFNATLLALAAALAAPAIAQEEPPSRVGRVSVIEGDVWLRDGSSTNPFIGTLNWPVMQGTAFETGLNARVEVRVGSTAVRFAPSTRARFDTLNDDAKRITLDRGSVSLRVRGMENARETVVVTPQGNIVFVDSGRYRVDVGSYGEVNVSVIRGNARFDGRSMSVSVPAGQQLQFLADGRSQFIGLDEDTFAAWTYDRDREYDRRPTPRYVSPELTGGEALEEHGSWTVSSSYGPVWYPNSYPVGWAPYRTGHWAWMQPWGWTWVDAQPWGFAVSHYGRWANIDGRWGWCPGQYVARPVWAPALVAWAGGSRWSVSVNLGYPSVGWVPLAPYEVFTPYYAAPVRYWQTVNSPYVRNVTVVNYVQQNPGSQSYANASVNGAVSAAASAATFARGAAATQAANAARGNTFVAVQSAVARDAFLGNRIVAPAANPNTVPQAVANSANNAAAVAAARSAAGGAPQPAQINPSIGTQRMVPDVTGRSDARVMPAQPQANNAAAANAAAQAARSSPNYIKNAPNPAPVPVQPQPAMRVAPPKDLRAEHAAAEQAARFAAQQQQLQQQQMQQRGWQQRPEHRGEMRVQPPPQAMPPQVQQLQTERKAPHQQPREMQPRNMERGNAQDAAVRAIRER